MRLAIVDGDEVVLLGSDLRERMIQSLALHTTVDQDEAREVVRHVLADEERSLRKRTISLGSGYASLRLAAVREIRLHAASGPRTRWEPLAYKDPAQLLRVRLLLAIGLQEPMGRLLAMGIVHAFFDVEERRALGVVA